MIEYFHPYNHILDLTQNQRMAQSTIDILGVIGTEVRLYLCAASTAFFSGGGILMIKLGTSASVPVILRICSK